RDIVHRDLQPDNVMLTAAGVKIIDFGVAAPVAAGVVGRSPGDDVYALGVLLYLMLTGASPYPSGPLLAPARIRRAAPTPVLVVPGLPPGTADLCRACMAKRPAGRPTAEAAAVALRGILDRPETLTPINV